MKQKNLGGTKQKMRPLGDAGDSEEDDEESMEALYRGRRKHQLGGYPFPVQSGDMAEDCARASSSVLPAVEQGPLGDEGEWQLLLQVDTDYDLDMEWEDAGMLYFWIRKGDLRKLCFENAWMILQTS